MRLPMPPNRVGPAAGWNRRDVDVRSGEHKINKVKRVSNRMKMEAKGRPLAWLAGDFDRALKLTRHNVMHKSHPHTGTLAGWFGREHRVENLGQDFRRDAAAVVAHGMVNAVT